MPASAFAEHIGPNVLSTQHWTRLLDWPTGAFGYFPSYTIGAVAAAQLFAAALVARPSIPAELSRGDFTTLRAYAREHVHQHGARYDTNAILQRATGRALDVDVLLAHLRRRYLDAASR